MSAVLVVTLTLANIGVESFPFGLGWHPFFPKAAATRLAFGADVVWRNDATQLPVERIAVPDEWRFDPPRALDAIALDNVFTGWRGAATVSDSAREIATTLSADRACAFVVVYAPPGRDFVAVEPVTHETDAFNRAAAGASATGMRMLPPGAAFSCTMRIAAAASAAARLVAHPMTSSFSCVLDIRASLGECPVWSIAEQALYWVDINAPSLNRFDPATGDNVAMPMPESIGSYALREGGGFVVALRSGIWLATRAARSSARSRPRRTIRRAIASTTAAAIRRAASSSAR